MPEAAEVETLSRQLTGHLPAKVLTAATWGERTVRAHDASLVTDLVGATFTHTSRRGKWLFIHTDDGRILVVHLRMSGRLHLVTPETPTELHTHAAFTLHTPGGILQLRFVDPRTFGELRVVSDPLEAAPDVPDVSEPLGLSSMPRSLTASRRSLKAVLLEQGLLVQGIGSYMADEICHEARLSPLRPCLNLTVQDWQRVLQAIPVCFERTTALRGVALEDEGWRDLYGALGDGAAALRVHARRVCGTCGGPVTRATLVGRSVYHCPRCQR